MIVGGDGGGGGRKLGLTIIEAAVKAFKKNGRCAGDKPPLDRNERSFRLAILIQQLSPLLFLPARPRHFLLFAVRVFVTGVPSFLSFEAEWRPI